MICNYYSNGKLLLTGEYLVLRGALALAMPVKYGQTMQVSAASKNINTWNSLEQSRSWFKLSFDPNLKIVATSNSDKANKLLKYIKQARKINPAFFNNKKYYAIKTNLNFNKEWGLGSSSTLISNIAYWAGIDPFEFFFSTESGSGYDIACARSDKALLYQVKNKKPQFQQIDFNPSFKNKIYFVYLGKKQNSSKEVAKFNRKGKIDNKLIRNISELTQVMVKTGSVNKFMQAMQEHEEIIAQVLKTKKVKEKYFSDFDGEIKSLGAWGGDFAMACSNMNQASTFKYFTAKKFKTVISYSDMVIDDKNLQTNLFN